MFRARFVVEPGSQIKYVVWLCRNRDGPTSDGSISDLPRSKPRHKPLYASGYSKGRSYVSTPAYPRLQEKKCEHPVDIWGWGMIGHNGPARGAGWFALSRDMINHPVVGFGQPVKPADKRRGAFSRAEAWIWMIANASYCERQFNNKGRVQTLEPGQLVGGRSYLAEEWNWSEQSVRTFLGKLQTEMMITLATDRIRNQQRHNTANIITLCNYIDYQLSLAEEQPADQPASNQQATSKQPASNQNLTNKQINKSHTEARTREAGPNEQEVAHGIIFNCETVRHKDGYFALSIPSIEMATQGTVPRDRVEAIVKGYALQWGLEIEAGKDPKRVIPNDAMAYVSAQVRKEFTRPIDAEFKRKRGETAAQKQKADLAQAWKKVLEQEAEKL